MEQNFFDRINYTDLAHFLQYGTAAQERLPQTRDLQSEIEQTLEVIVSSNDWSSAQEILWEIEQLKRMAFRDGIQAGLSLGRMLLTPPRE